MKACMGPGFQLTVGRVKGPHSVAAAMAARGLWGSGGVPGSSTWHSPCRYHSSPHEGATGMWL
jgi:hypothetical protein